MKPFVKALVIHLGIFLGYTLLLLLLSRNGEGFLIVFWVSILQFIVGAVIGLVQLATAQGDERKRMSGLGNLLGGFLTIIIGFASCFILLSGLSL